MNMTLFALLLANIGTALIETADQIKNGPETGTPKTTTKKAKPVTEEEDYTDDTETETDTTEDDDTEVEAAADEEEETPKKAQPKTKGAVTPEKVRGVFAKIPKGEALKILKKLNVKSVAQIKSTNLSWAYTQAQKHLG